MTFILGFWRSRWCLLRLAVAITLLALFALDFDRAMARLRLQALPDMDFAAEVRSLTAQGRLGEAVVVADAGLAAAGPDQATAEPIRVAREQAQAEQASWLRSAREVGLGALTGRGESAERLVGAVASDFFLVGDVRDLVLQGVQQATTGDADEVIVALSTLGIVTTLAPEIDWAPSILKAARKAGALSAKLQAHILDAVKGRKVTQVQSLCADAATLSTHLSPGGAIKAMRGAQDAEDLAALAAFVNRRASGSGAALAVHVAGPEAAQVARAGNALAEARFIDAARKGKPGIAWFTSAAGKAAIKPHALLGLGKGLWKGNLTALAERIVERLGPQAWWIIPLLCVWTLLELGCLWRGLGGLRSAGVTTPRGA